jgi:hypothetical protein
MRGWNFHWASGFQHSSSSHGSGSGRFCIVLTPKKAQLLASRWCGLCGNGGGGWYSAMSFPHIKNTIPKTIKRRSSSVFSQRASVALRPGDKDIYTTKDWCIKEPS